MVDKVACPLKVDSFASAGGSTTITGMHAGRRRSGMCIPADRRPRRRGVSEASSNNHRSPWGLLESPFGPANGGQKDVRTAASLSFPDA